MDTSIAAPQGARETLTLSRTQVDMEPGGPEEEVVITLFNTSDVVEQYTIEVTNLDPAWFTAPVTSVGLFPQDKDTLTLKIHPPRNGAKAGTYPFQVIARTRDQKREYVAQGTLELSGYVLYRVNVTPRNLTTSGTGAYRVELINVGTADGRLHIEGKDDEDACRFKYPRGNEVLVAANSKQEVPLIVDPKRKPLVGKDRDYGFGLAVRPVGVRGEPQTIPGLKFTHHPRFQTLPILPILKWLLIALVALVVLGLLMANEIPQQFGQRVRVASAQLCGSATWLSRTPVLGGVCPETAAPANPDRCAFALGFKDFASEQPRLVGKCFTDEVYDRFGNNMQWTTTGLLLWLKASNTVYFIERDNVYSYIDGKLKLLDGAGAPIP